MKTFGSILITAVLTVLLTGCMHSGPKIEKAVAVISPTAGNKTNGIVTFPKVESGIRIQAIVTGLKPGDH